MLRGLPAQLVADGDRQAVAAGAQWRIDATELGNVTIRVGDGSRGWAEHAPFRKILVAAGSKTPPPALIEQLEEGGRMVMPLGAPDAQRLCVIEKKDGIHTRELMAVRFSELETVI